MIRKMRILNRRSQRAQRKSPAQAKCSDFDTEGTEGIRDQLPGRLRLFRNSPCPLCPVNCFSWIRKIQGILTRRAQRKSKAVAGKAESVRHFSVSSAFPLSNAFLPRTCSKPWRKLGERLIIFWQGVRLLQLQLPEKREARDRIVKKVRVFYDREGNTLNVWFDDPKKEYVCEESGDDVILEAVSKAVVS
jgi:hypothetical protein